MKNQNYLKKEQNIFAAERKGCIQETVELLNSLGKVKVTTDNEKIVIE